MTDPTPPEAEPPTEPDKTASARVVFVGMDMGAIPARAMAHHGGDVLIIGDDMPLCRGRDPGLSLGARVLGRAIAAALSGPVMDVPLVRLQQERKPTLAAWRRQMKGTR